MFYSYSPFIKNVNHTFTDAYHFMLGARSGTMLGEK